MSKAAQITEKSQSDKIKQSAHSLENDPKEVRWINGLSKVVNLKPIETAK